MAALGSAGERFGVRASLFVEGALFCDNVYAIQAATIIVATVGSLMTTYLPHARRGLSSSGPNPVYPTSSYDEVG